LSTVNIGVLGLGTVGSGTVNVLARNAQEITRRTGRKIKVTHAAARDLSIARECDTTDIQLTTDPFAVVRDADVEIIVELIGGTTLALQLVMEAIEAGKHVVTANKALIACHGNEIFKAASQRGVMVAFEAAVAGGIPIIKVMREALAGNKIEWLAGIINGTGNFILTEMRDKGRDFNDVLEDAQRLGYAEADPAFDIEGIDAAHKLTILSSIAFGIPLQFSKAYTEGLTNITQEDVRYAEELGYRIKHLGISRRTAQGIELRVHPALVPERRLLANVDGVMNAVVVKGDAVGPTLYYGAGAGADPTASAVVGDIVDVVRALGSQEAQVPYLAFQPDALSDFPILDMGLVETAYYLRMQVSDQPGVLASISKVLADQHISIEALIQKEPEEGCDRVPLIMLTHCVQERRMEKALQEIEELADIDGKITRIRVESLG
jgi:homoserine dehydrogenase